MNETPNSNTATTATACACAAPGQPTTPVLQAQNQPIAQKNAPDSPKVKRGNYRKK